MSFTSQQLFRGRHGTRAFSIHNNCHLALQVGDVLVLFSWFNLANDLQVGFEKIKVKSGQPKIVTI